MQGGIHFITSRILMVDLLQNRVPVKNVAGIIVHHAHQLVFYVFIDEYNSQICLYLYLNICHFLASCSPVH